MGTPFVFSANSYPQLLLRECYSQKYSRFT